MLVTHPAGRLLARPGPSLLADLVTLSRPLHAMKRPALVPIALVDSLRWTTGELAAVGWAAGAFVIARRGGVRRQRRRRPGPGPAPSGQVPATHRRRPGLGPRRNPVLRNASGRTRRADRARTGWPYWPVLAYLVLSAAYSRGLKHVALVDVGTVALGFVLRIVQGYVALDEPVSACLVVAVLSVSLLLLTGKRRHELLGAGAAHRPALRGYSVELINLLLPLTGVLSVVAGLSYLATDAPFGSYHQVRCCSPRRSRCSRCSLPAGAGGERRWRRSGAAAAA